MLQRAFHTAETPTHAEATETRYEKVTRYFSVTEDLSPPSSQHAAATRTEPWEILCRGRTYV